MKTHTRTKADGRKVRVDSNPKNDYSDGRNAGVRKSKDDIKVLTDLVNELNKENAELKEDYHKLREAYDECSWDKRELQARLEAHEYKIKVSLVLLSVLAGALIVFVAMLATDLGVSFLSLLK